MKSKMRIFLTAMILTAVSATSVFGASMASAVQKVQISSGTKSVSTITVDLTNPNIEMFPVLANNKVGTANSLYKVAESWKNADTVNIAAINGDFFAAYDGTNLPYGISKKDGEIFHSGGNLMAFAFDSSFQSAVAELGLAITFTTVKADGYEFTWEAWGINHVFNYDGEITVYTPYYGSETKRGGGVGIVVRKGVVTEIANGNAPIYPDGYTIFANNSDKLISRISVGDTMSYQYTYQDEKTNENLGWNSYDTIVSGGPILVKNKAVLTDFASQGFEEAKILTQKAQRSFMLVTGDKKLVIGTVASVSMNELAEIAKSMGAVNAINLDGGSSSGLYMNGKMITTPGRDLTNVIIVREIKNKIKISLNGSNVTLENKVLNVDGRNYCPANDVAAALGLVIGWNGETQSVTMQKDNLKLEFRIGEKSYLKNGQRIVMDAAPFIDAASSRTYLPVRYMTEPFGYEIDWDAESSTILIRKYGNSEN